MAARDKASNDGGGSRKEEPEKLTRKEYEEHLAKLHVELVKLQEWIKHKGLKVCIVFEGRDGAGKGGTIKAITERVAGLEDERAALLVSVGALHEGTKVVLAVESGQRESTASWARVLRSLRERGRRPWKAMVADGHLGIWGALREVVSPPARSCGVGITSSLTEAEASLGVAAAQPAIRSQPDQSGARTRAPPTSDGIRQLAHGK